MSGTPGYVRWIPEEWSLVAVNLLPLLTDGKQPNLELLRRAMKRCLPEERWRDDESLNDAARPSSRSLQKYLAMAREMPAEQRAVLTVPVPERKKPAPRKKLDEGREYSGGFRWTTREKALLTRMVLWMQEQGSDKSVGRLLIEAQEVVLPADRRRAVAGIIQGNTQGTNAKIIEEGKANLWLVQDIPFNPTGQAHAEPDATPAGAVVADTSGVAPRRDEETPQEPPQPVAATQPLPSTRSSLGEAIQAFGAQIVAGMAQVMAVHERCLMDELAAKLAAPAAPSAPPVIDVNELSTTIAAVVSAQIERGMRAVIHTMVEAELGGPVRPPAQNKGAAPEVAAAAGASPSDPATVTADGSAAPPANPDPHPPGAGRVEPARQDRLVKVDIVGFNEASIEQQIRQAINGDGSKVDLRFIGPDSKSSYAPHKGREVIMLTHRVSHALKDKIKASGIRPIYTKPTVGHVVRALQDLCRANGVPFTH